MRLDETDIKLCVNVLSQYIHEAADLRLFGSRVNDDAKGGDIDLILLVTSPDTAEDLIYFKAKILSEIKAGIGDQKIDLLVAPYTHVDPFIEVILPDSVLLHHFVGA